MRKLVAFIFVSFILFAWGTVGAQPVNTLVDVGTSNTNAMSPNGNVLIGETGWYWTYNDGKIFLSDDAVSIDDVTNDTLIVGSFRDPNALTPDGDTSAVAGYWKNDVWTALGQMPGVPYFDYDSDDYSRAWGISNNGQYIVGHQKFSNGDFEAWVWDEINGYTLLGHRYRGSRANAVSDDGSIIVGWDEMESGPREAVFWDPDTNFINPGYAGEIFNITPDGTWMVGKTDGYAFRWSEAGGIENLTEGITKTGWAITCSANGSVVGGGVGSGGYDSEAFIWTESEGFEYFQDYLDAKGISTIAWQSLYWITGISGDGTIFSGYGRYKPDLAVHSFWVKIDDGSAIEDAGAVHVTDFRLEQNYPNPFNPVTTIRYELPITNFVELNIYNILGQKIAVLVSERQRAGQHVIQWDAARFNSGIYFCQMHSGSFSAKQKLILLK